MPAGRPSAYKPEYGEEIIQLMAAGLSLTAAAAELGFHRDTVYQWAETHEEFSDALKLGRGKRVLSLERDLLDKDMAGPQITARIFALKNAAPDEWREKVQQEVTGKDGAPLVAAPDAPELARQIAFALAKGSQTG